MKITRLELFKVPPRWLFLKVSTDAGLSGWGEPIVEGRAETTRAAVSELGSYLIGRSPLTIEDHFQVLYRGGFYRGGPVLMSAISGIEQALWDIKGRYYNAPVYELLGGAVRQSIGVYSWIGGDAPENVAAQARERVAAGFTALKMNAGEAMPYIDSPQSLEAIVARVAAVRAAVGGGIGLGLDFHGRVHRAMAKVLLRELEPFQLMFVEEPVLPEHLDCLSQLTRNSSVPIATGERLYTRWGFKALLESRCVDVIQPDLSHAGGILEVRKIAAMAEAYDVALAPHCPLGPIALAAALQVDACTPNFLIQEQSLNIHYHVQTDLLDYLEDPSELAFSSGSVATPSGPGLGITVAEERVREAAAAAAAPDWHNPVWRLPDGSVAEW